MLCPVSENLKQAHLEYDRLRGTQNLELHPSATAKRPSMLTWLDVSSLACRYNSRSRRWLGHFGHLLPMDIATTTQDVHKVLGLQPSFRRGSPDDDQQIQHFPSACPDGIYRGGTAGDRYRSRTRLDWFAVSHIYSLVPCPVPCTSCPAFQTRTDHASIKTTAQTVAFGILIWASSHVVRDILICDYASSRA